MRRAAPVLIALTLGCSGPLEGEPAAQPVSDWASLAEADDLALATGSGRRFRLVAADVFAQGGALYLHVFTIFAFSDGALNELLEGGRVQLRSNGVLHALRATQLRTAAEIGPLLPDRVRELGIEATGMRWDPDPERYPNTQIRQWWFRLDPADG